MTSTNPPEHKNIILDLDGTLVDAQSSVGANSAIILGRGAPSHICGREFGHLHIYKRPGLDDFLSWCFDSFENVGGSIEIQAIWTLSSREWLNEVLDNVLSDYPREKWSFLWSGERATRVMGSNGDALMLRDVAVIKDLNKVYRNKTLKRRGYTRWNTIIVEDNPCNCIRNYGNAVYSYLRTTILNCRNVRCLDKRDWLRDTEAEEQKRIASDRSQSDKTAFWMKSDTWNTPAIVSITTGSF